MASLDKLYSIIDASDLPGNLFVKHLVVLADFGGEMLQRVNTQLGELFPDGKLTYQWRGSENAYRFRQMPVSSLNNQKLGISGKKILEKQELSDLHKDVIALLIFGSSCTTEETAQVLLKCEIGEYLGNPKELHKYVKERYIWVSRITGGSQANALGQEAQNYVEKYLRENLKINGLQIRRNSSIPGVTHTGGARPTTFDLVLTTGSKYAAVEISFQVTTNSTIERKAGQAESRFKQVEKLSHRIAYVIDGAGNFQRQNAIGTLCSYSHCTVAFSDAELAILSDFLREYFR